MKPLTDLYPRITAFSNLLEASRRAQRGKRYRADVLAFNARLEANLFLLQHELRAFTYAPGPYRRFWISRSKTSADFSCALSRSGGAPRPLRRDRAAPGAGFSSQ